MIAQAFVISGVCECRSSPSTKLYPHAWHLYRCLPRTNPFLPVCGFRQFLQVIICPPPCQKPVYGGIAYHIYLDFNTLNKYPGVVIAWDVVNEPFSDQTDANGNLLPRKTVFNTIDSNPLDNIAVAFRAARTADPNAILWLNDYTNQGGLASPNDQHTEQEFQLVSSLKAAGVPIDCIGMEMHLGVGWQFQRYQGVLDTMKRYAGIGVQMQVTEFDFGMKSASKTDLNKQATFYHDMLQACIASANCTQFTTWRFTNKYSWIPSFFSGYGFTHGWLIF
jgi:endo-1,4-beta-xylanase